MARDAEVRHARLRDLLAAEPDVDDVRQHVDRVMTERYRAAHDAVLEALDGDRCRRLVAALERLAAAPPFRPAASGDAAEVLPRLVRRTWRRLARTMRAAERAPRGPAQDELLHRARKDAKRSRYAAAVARLQESLGELQDGVVTRQVLRELAAGGAGSFVLGRLDALEQARAEAALARWPQVRAAVSRRGLRRWLDA